MKEIPLTQDKVALVDDEDYDYLIQFKWYAHHRGNVTESINHEWPCSLNEVLYLIDATEESLRGGSG